MRTLTLFSIYIYTPHTFKVILSAEFKSNKLYSKAEKKFLLPEKELQQTDITSIAYVLAPSNT